MAIHSNDRLIFQARPADVIPDDSSGMQDIRLLFVECHHLISHLEWQYVGYI